MQKLIVACLVLVSCLILYRKLVTPSQKYAIRLLLSKLFDRLHIPALAKAVYPGDRQPAAAACCGCDGCAPKKDPTTHTVRIYRKIR